MAAESGGGRGRARIPCTIDRERGVAISAVNLPIVDVPIRDLMRERLGLPVFVDNDANAAALAEHRCGAARGATKRRAADDRHGHRRRADPGRRALPRLDRRRRRDGPRGRRGRRARRARATAQTTAASRRWRRAPRWPATAARRPSATRIRRSARALAAGEEIDGQGGSPTPRSAATRLQSGVVEARVAISGVALSSLANTFDPDVIVIGGGVMAAGDLLLEPARAELRARALPPHEPAPGGRRRARAGGRDDRRGDAGAGWAGRRGGS